MLCDVSRTGPSPFPGVMCQSQHVVVPRENGRLGGRARLARGGARSGRTEGQRSLFRRESPRSHMGVPHLRRMSVHEKYVTCCRTSQTGPTGAAEQKPAVWTGCVPRHVRRVRLAVCSGRRSITKSLVPVQVWAAGRSECLAGDVSSGPQGSDLDGHRCFRLEEGACGGGAPGRLGRAFRQSVLAPPPHIGLLAKVPAGSTDVRQTPSLEGPSPAKTPRGPRSRGRVGGPTPWEGDP